LSHSFLLLFVFVVRSGAGAPVVGECEGDYRHDSRKNILEWRLPVIDASNKSGSMEFTVTGHANDFFPVAVNFVSKKSFCDIEVSSVCSWTVIVTLPVFFVLNQVPRNHKM